MTSYFTGCGQLMTPSSEDLLSRFGQPHMRRMPDGLMLENFPQGTSEDLRIAVEFRDDAGIPAVLGGLKFTNTTDATPTLQTAKILRNVRYLINWARIVGDKTGYGGVWSLGMHATALIGVHSQQWQDRVVLPTWAYQGNEYTETYQATHQQLDGDQGGVAYALTARLLRGLGTTGWWPDLVKWPDR